MNLCSIELIEITNLALRNVALANQRAVGNTAAEMLHADVEADHLVARKVVVEPRPNRCVERRRSVIRRTTWPSLRRPDTVIIVNAFPAEPFGAHMRFDRSSSV